MKKFFITLLLLNLIAIPVMAEDVVKEEIKNITTQEIQNETTYLGANFLKAPAEPNAKQLITNHKSFLILNVIINGKLKEKNQ